MSFRVKRIVVITALICVTGLSTTAYAGLQDALDGMFMSNTTEPSSFSNQSRGGLIGGGASVRMPIRNINVVAFDPPRISAGCGGIDLFGGAFSFINADQLVALFRQIAANAVGVAFKAAIDAINPALGKLMQDFQNKIASLNNMMKNTCAVATTLMDKTGLSDDIKGFVQQNVVPAIDTADGAMNDWFKSIDNFLGSPNSGRDARDSGKAPQLGNATWKALKDSHAGEMLGDPSGNDPSPDSANEVVMSLIGAVIIGPQGDADQENPDGSVQVDNGRYWAPTLRLNDLRDGSSNGPNKPVVLLRCQDGYDPKKCLKISKVSTNFLGVRGYVQNMLFGDPNGKSTTLDSVVGKLTSCSGNGCNFTQAQKTFIGSISAPVLGMMKKVQSMPGAADHIAHILEPVIVDELSIKFAESALNAARSAFSGTNYTPDEVIQKEQQNLLSEVIQLRNTSTQQLTRINEAIAYAKAINQDNPAVFVKPNIR